jgi:signal peptidase I
MANIFKTPPGLKPAKKAENLNETIRTIVYAVLIALVIRTFTWQPYNIPSGSMIPTFLVGYYLFASKYAYGFSEFSFPVDLPIFSGRILDEHKPERGDVVIFKLPKDNSTDYIKRIIGLPGDKIQVMHGQLYLNGQPVPREAMPDYVDYSGTHRRFMETLPNGVKHQILQDGDEGFLDNTQLYIVPADHYFCMGDNRTNSQDSRVLGEVGYVPYINLEAKAGLIFFSLDERAHFWEIWKWPEDLRISRIFNSVS